MAGIGWGGLQPRERPASQRQPPKVFMLDVGSPVEVDLLMGRRGQAQTLHWPWFDWLPRDT